VERGARSESRKLHRRETMTTTESRVSLLWRQPLVRHRIRSWMERAAM
jgi:hypothetical protein